MKLISESPTNVISFLTDCGIPNEGDDKSKIDGSQTDNGEYPWQVSNIIFYKIVQNIKTFTISGWNNV